MNIAPTSIDAHSNVIVTGRSQTNKSRILAFFSVNFSNGKRREFTRNETAEYLDIRLSTVCGAVNALVKEGKLVELAERLDYFTDERAKVLSVPLTQFNDKSRIA